MSRGWAVDHSKRISGSARCLQPLGPPLPGLDRGDPKTAQIGPGLSQTDIKTIRNDRFVNILDNAIKYNENFPEITVKTKNINNM